MLRLKKSASRLPANTFLGVIFALSLFSLSSCQTAKTVIPSPIVDTQPSWDGNEQNSGIIEYVKGGGFSITENAALRYSFLTKTYGSKLSPPLKGGEGLIYKDDLILLPNQYMVEFMTLSKIHKTKTSLIEKD